MNQLPWIALTKGALWLGAIGYLPTGVHAPLPSAQAALEQAQDDLEEEAMFADFYRDDLEGELRRAQHLIQLDSQQLHTIRESLEPNLKALGKKAAEASPEHLGEVMGLPQELKRALLDALALHGNETEVQAYEKDIAERNALRKRGAILRTLSLLDQYLAPTPEQLDVLRKRIESPEWDLDFSLSPILSSLTVPSPFQLLDPESITDVLEPAQREALTHYQSPTPDVESDLVEILFLSGGRLTEEESQQAEQRLSRYLAHIQKECQTVLVLEQERLSMMTTLQPADRKKLDLATKGVVERTLAKKRSAVQEYLADPGEAGEFPSFTVIQDLLQPTTSMLEALTLWHKIVSKSLPPQEAQEFDRHQEERFRIRHEALLWQLALDRGDTSSMTAEHINELHELFRDHSSLSGNYFVVIREVLQIPEEAFKATFPKALFQKLYESVVEDRAILGKGEAPF